MMDRPHRSGWGLLLLLLCGTPVFGEARFAPVFTSDMVLQRGDKIRFWGEAAPEERVTVTAGGGRASTVADRRGRWRVEMPGLPVGGPYKVVLSGGKNQQELSNVLSGDVWFCSGQSNMAWGLDRASDAAAALAKADDPNLRLFQVPRSIAARPSEEMKGKWEPSTRSNAGRFSAVAYFFGRELRRRLNVPVGLVNASWGGSRIEGWTSLAGYAATPGLAVEFAKLRGFVPGSPENRRAALDTLGAVNRWLAAAHEAEKNGDPLPVLPRFLPEMSEYTWMQSPAALYNGMVHAFSPMAVRGVLWYQGCANRENGAFYRERMNGIYQSFALAFGNPQLPFYFVQLAPYRYDNRHWLLPELWAAQARFARENPRAHMAVINDVGNVRDIHPRDKTTVGLRLANLALKYEYGSKEVAPDFPEPESLKIEDAKVRVTFRNAESLKTSDGKSPDRFEIAGADGVFHAASAMIEGRSVVLESRSVRRPYVVRFAWSGVAEPNLRNEHGLPAGAFELGRVPERGKLDTYVPEAKNFSILLRCKPLTASCEGGRRVRYLSDYREKFAGRKLKRVGYFFTLRRPSREDFVFAAMTPFARDVSVLGVPTAESGRIFQVPVHNLEIKSNVPGVMNGKFAAGNIEFWPNNYSELNTARVEGASDTRFDFGDAVKGESAEAGYGSMQLHNTRCRQTVFAWNNWRALRQCDLGIGDAPSGQPDWTFSRSGAALKDAELLVLAECE